MSTPTKGRGRAITLAAPRPMTATKGPISASAPPAKQSAGWRFWRLPPAPWWRCAMVSPTAWRAAMPSARRSPGGSAATALSSITATAGRPSIAICGKGRWQSQRATRWPRASGSAKSAIPAWQPLPMCILPCATTTRWSIPSPAKRRARRPVVSLRPRCGRATCCKPSPTGPGRCSTSALRRKPRRWSISRRVASPARRRRATGLCLSPGAGRSICKRATR